MPELPEVEAARRLAHKHCCGKKIAGVTVTADDKVFQDKTPAEVEAALRGRSVADTARKGKYFWFLLSGAGAHVLLHFGMTGYLAIKDHGAAKYVRIKDSAEWPPAYTKLELEFEDGTRMAFADARRFARIKLLADPASEEPVGKLGPDAFLELPPPEPFAALLARHKRSLKAVLLDQAVLSGIGNWVADEVLYQARLYPEMPACDATAEQAAALRGAIMTVLAAAVAVDSDAAQLPPEWLFHFRWTGKTATKDYHGNVVSFLKVGGRTTAFVLALQPKPATSSVPARKRPAAKTPAAKRPRKKAAPSSDESSGGSDSGSDSDASAGVPSSDSDSDFEEGRGRKKGRAGKAPLRRAAKRGPRVVAGTTRAADEDDDADAVAAVV